MAAAGDLLLVVRVEHEYCEDVARCGLRFVPDAGTTHWLQRRRATLRSGCDGFAIAATLADGEQATLGLDLHADDPLFGNYTAGLPAPGDDLLRCDSADATADERGEWWLRPAPARASAERSRPAAPHSGPLRPVASLTLRADAALAGRHYRLRLAARATHWKYLLIGDWSDEAPQVVDAADDVRFEPPARAELADGRPALAIRSVGAIALRARPPQRFQLRSARAGATGDRLLVRRLPAAAPDHFALDQVGGRPALVSEIIVPR